MAPITERISTGIPGLDNMTSGGFVKGHTILLCGTYGTGKTTFCLQFLVDGAKRGENGLFITFEEDPEQLAQEGEEFGWDIKGLEKQNKLKIIRISPQDLLNLVEAGFGQIGGVIKGMDVKRIIVDPIIMFDLLGKDEYEKRKYVLDFVTWLKKHGCTAIITMDEVPGTEDDAHSGIAESVVDAIIALYHPQEKKRRTRAIEIIKMRETKHSEELADFEIDSNGIVVKSGGN